MEFKIVWSDFAERQVDKIFLYYEEVAGLRIAINLVQGILKEPSKLLINPYTGQPEGLLTGRKEIYHYIIYKSYKIIYSVDKNKGL